MCSARHCFGSSEPKKRSRRFSKAGEASPNWSWGLAQGLAFAGRIDEARALARELEAREFPDAWALAEVYCAIGDLDRAVHWVEQGYEKRRDWMPWIKVNTFNATAIQRQALPGNPAANGLARVTGRYSA